MNAPVNPETLKKLDIEATRHAFIHLNKGYESNVDNIFKKMLLELKNHSDGLEVGKHGQELADLKIEHEKSYKALEKDLAEITTVIVETLKPFNEDKARQDVNFAKVLDRMPGKDVFGAVQNKLVAENRNVELLLHGMHTDISRSYKELVKNKGHDHLSSEGQEVLSKYFDEVIKVHQRDFHRNTLREENLLYVGHDYNSFEGHLLDRYRQIAAYQWVQHYVDTKKQFNYEKWSPSEYSIDNGFKRDIQSGDDIDISIAEQTNPFWLEFGFRLSDSEHIYNGTDAGQFKIIVDNSKGRTLTASGGGSSKAAYHEKVCILMREAKARNYYGVETSPIGKGIKDLDLVQYLRDEAYYEGRRIGIPHDNITLNGKTFDKLKEAGDKLSKEYDEFLKQKLDKGQKESLFELINETGLHNNDVNLEPAAFLKLVDANLPAAQALFAKASPRQQAKILQTSTVSDANKKALFTVSDANKKALFIGADGKKLTAKAQAAALNSCDADLQKACLDYIDDANRHGVYQRMTVAARANVFAKLGDDVQDDYLRRASTEDRKVIIYKSDLSTDRIAAILSDVYKIDSNIVTHILEIKYSQREFIKAVFTHFGFEKQLEVKLKLSSKLGDPLAWLTHEIKDKEQESDFNTIKSLSAEKQYQLLVKAELLSQADQSAYFKSLSFVQKAMLLSAFPNENDALQKLGQWETFTDAAELLQVRIYLALANKYGEMTEQSKQDSLDGILTTLNLRDQFIQEVQQNGGPVPLTFTVALDKAIDDFKQSNDFAELRKQLFKNDSAEEQYELVKFILNQQADPLRFDLAFTLLETLGDNISPKVFDLNFDVSKKIKIFQLLKDNPTKQAEILEKMVPVNAEALFNKLDSKEKGKIANHLKKPGSLFDKKHKGKKGDFAAVLKEIKNADKLYELAHGDKEKEPEILDFNDFSLIATYLSSLKFDEKERSTDIFAKFDNPKKRRVYDALGALKAEDALGDLKAEYVQYLLFKFMDIKDKKSVIGEHIPSQRRAYLIQSDESKNSIELLAGIENSVEFVDVFILFDLNSKIALIDKLAWDDSNVKYLINILENESKPANARQLFKMLKADTKKLVGSELDSKDSLYEVLIKGQSQNHTQNRP